MLKHGLRCRWRPLRLRSRCEEMRVRRERQYRLSLVSPFPLLINYVQRRGLSIQQYIIRYTPEQEQKHKNDENNITADTHLPIIGLSLTWHRQSDTRGPIHQLLGWSVSHRVAYASEWKCSPLGQSKGDPGSVRHIAVERLLNRTRRKKLWRFSHNIGSRTVRAVSARLEALLSWALWFWTRDSNLARSCFNTRVVWEDIVYLDSTDDVRHEAYLLEIGFIVMAHGSESSNAEMLPIWKLSLGIYHPRNGELAM